MPRTLGISFQPGVDSNNGLNYAQNGQGLRNPVQEAIKVLSLRTPTVFGARAIAPAPLLTAIGGMGQPAAKSNVSAQALAALAGVPLPPMPAPVLPVPAPSPAPPRQSFPEPTIPVLPSPRPSPDVPRMPTFTPTPSTPAPYPDIARRPPPFPLPPFEPPTPSRDDRRNEARDDERYVPAPAPAPPQFPSPIPPPRIIPGKDTGEGKGPPADRADDMIIGTRTSAPPQPVDVQAIQEIANQIFRKFPMGLDPYF